MAAAPSPLTAEWQEELLLAHGLPFKSWRADVPLSDFEGVTVSVGDDGLVVGLDFAERREIQFNLGDFAPLVSLKEINFRDCRAATGEFVYCGAGGLLLLK